MLTPQEICALATKAGVSAFTGVPDSTLSNFTDYLVSDPDLSKRCFIAHNEGGAVAFASGYYLATSQLAMVYMQNSGIGNAVNPIVSLAEREVYGIPIFYIIGWRGEPDVHDEPQHMYQGKITLEMLDMLGIMYMVVDSATTSEDVETEIQKRFIPAIAQAQSVALVMKKGAISKAVTLSPESKYHLSREEAIQIVLNTCEKTDAVISTTGKSSREVFEYRESRSEGHAQDFLMVGSMGHAASLALGISVNHPEKRIWILDGDGAVIMHMGALTMVGYYAPSNYVHVVINNEMYESVGLMPTVSGVIDYCALAKAAGYTAYFLANDADSLKDALMQIKDSRGPILLEIKTSYISRKNLGRPTKSPQENKNTFMAFVQR